MVHGSGTKFTAEFEPGDELMIHERPSLRARVVSVESDDQLALHESVEPPLKEGQKFKVTLNSPNRYDNSLTSLLRYTKKWIRVRCSSKYGRNSQRATRNLFPFFIPSTTHPFYSGLASFLKVLLMTDPACFHYNQVE